MSNKAIAEKYQKIAQDLVSAYKGEMSVREALIKNGIAEGQANKGWTLVRNRKALNTAFETALREDYANQPMIDMTPEQDVKLINSRLRQNLIEGKDKAVQSAKVLGSRKDLNMWANESFTGVVIIEVPKNLPDPTPYLSSDEIKQITGRSDG